MTSRRVVKWPCLHTNPRTEVRAGDGVRVHLGEEMVLYTKIKSYLLELTDDKTLENIYV